jgi:hypothetical protein
MEQEQTEETDIIDIELSKLLESLLEVDEVDDDVAFNEAEDVLYDVIGDLEDKEVIAEIPDENAEEEEKKAWLEVSLPIIEQALEAALNEEDWDDSEEIPDEEEPE